MNYKAELNSFFFLQLLMKSLSITPKSPYNIRLHFDRYTSYKNGQWWQAFRLKNEKIVPVQVILNKDIDNPQLTVNIFANIETKDESEIIERIKRVFNTGYDLKSLYNFMENDKRLKALSENHYGLLPASFSSVYEATIATIIQQQISLKIAWHMTALLIKKFGECIKIDDKEFWTFPTPSTLANADISELRKCKLSARKGEYIKDFSEAVESGKFVPESLRKLSHQEIIECLTQFRGMGRWTAEMVIVTSIGLDGMNVAGDLGARKAISHFFNSDKLMPEDEVRKLTDKWGKYKGIITYYYIAEMLR